MQAIHDLIGIPFVDGGRDISGCDCWGLTMIAWRILTGKELPDYKIACEEASLINAKINEQKCNWVKIEEKDLVVPSLVVMRFNSVTLCNHTGIYIGGRNFLHTSRKVNSHISSIDSPAWNRRIEGFYILKESG